LNWHRVVDIGRTYHERRAGGDFGEGKERKTNFLTHGVQKEMPQQGE